MTDMEKVITKLENWRETCPFEKCAHCGAKGKCTNPIFEDALALLKAQMPRVMTLDEIHACNEGDCLYYQCEGEFDGNVLYIGSEVGYYVDLRTSIHRFTCDPSLYGSWWRCWTSRPSPELMASTPWDVSPELRKKWELDDEIASGIGQTFSTD